MRRRRSECESRHGNPAEAADRLATRLRVNGAAQLTVDPRLPQQLLRIGEAARRARSQTEVSTPALDWLCGFDRSLAATARACRARRARKLPAVDGVPRILYIARALVGDGCGALEIEDMRAGLARFDAIQELTMAELWLAPMAARIALIELFAETARDTLADARDRARAERWIAGGADMRGYAPDRSAAFCEYALSRLHEIDKPQARCALEDVLASRAGGAARLIERAHGRAATQSRRYACATAGLRALDQAVWKTEFEAISRADQLLRADPLYPHMDEASRRVVREETAALSRKSGLSECTVARHALDAAQSMDDAARGSVCWWLCDDIGRAALMKKLGAPSGSLVKRAPDPKGHAYLTCFAALWVLIFLPLSDFCGAPYALPVFLLCWRYASAALGMLITRVHPPVRLLKLDYAQVPDDRRTLVVMPALLSGEARCKALVDQLAALGALVHDGNIRFLLLGDFRDADGQSEPDDEAIVRAARDGIARLNDGAGYEKYYFLHRERTYMPRDQRFMARERKRGALMALNAALLGRENAFVETALPRDIRYVVTLDADTRMLPDALFQMIGAMAHPLNAPRYEDGRRRGYAILQPRVEVTGANRFAALMAGRGGLDSYPTAVSNASWDFCGRGLYSGKGIYDLRAFDAALFGQLPDGAILSHDLIEGVLAGTGYLGDVALFDSFPATLTGYLKRLDRWTRGDWQLAPFLFGRPRLTAFDRFLMLDNLARSLAPVAAICMIVLACWRGDAPALLTALILPFLPPLLALPALDGAAWSRGVTALSLFPAEAWTLARAITRALYRVCRSRRGLLEWTPAADADRPGRSSAAVPGRFVAVLLLPALLRPSWITAALGLILLFATGVSYVETLTERAGRERLAPAHIAELREIARRTWLFFDTYVTAEVHDLPPDNVQYDPPVGVAARTSPTNIGLYMVSCVAASRLGLIGEADARARIARTLDTLEQLDTWHGHLYNWYDTGTLEPLTPRYVSAVDSGNLAACLLLCAQALGGAEGARAKAFARATDFTMLYDAPRELFRIGVDVTNDRTSDAHYDLLASEARLLSYVAIMLGQAPIAHWFAPGRGRSGQALHAWSGTLFEYLMPELFLRSPEGSLLETSNRAAVKAQSAIGYPIWGVSESGYFAFDLKMNYQYRAFGLPSLSLRGDAFERVVAPYASLLALPIDASAVCVNIANMRRLGLLGEYGFYEALDAEPSRMPAGADRRIVRSHMAHHQGMILCAICNELTDGALTALFAAQPEAAALLPLLAEKSAPPAPSLMAARRAEARVPSVRRVGAGRAAQTDTAIPDTHLLSGQGALCLAGARGAIFYRRGDVLANRFGEGILFGETDGLFHSLRVDGRAVQPSRARFAPGVAQYRAEAAELSMTSTLCVSPEDGALYEAVTLRNQSDAPRAVDATLCFPVALCAQAALRAHPAFQNLFVRAVSPAPGRLVFTRRAREGGDTHALACALIAPPGADYAYETDLERLTGRDASGAAFGVFSGVRDRTLNPCAAISARFTLPPGDQAQLAFCEYVGDPAEALAFAPRLQDASRAQWLAEAGARARLDFLRMETPRAHLLHRAAAYLFYPALKRETAADRSVAPSMLWAFGLSGDLPIIAVFLTRGDALSLARDAARAHEFYRLHGVLCDIVYVLDTGADYRQGVRDDLLSLIASGHLQHLANKRGGVYLIEGAALADDQRFALARIAAIVLRDGADDFAAQLRAALARPVVQTPAARPQNALPQPVPPLEQYNGFGGFQGDRYIVTGERTTPRAWCNVLANPDFGAVLSERGGGFLYCGNSRLRRLTPYTGDALREGFAERAALTEADTGARYDILPAKRCVRAAHGQGETVFEAVYETLAWTLTVFVDPARPVKTCMLAIRNPLDQPRALSLSVAVDFLMGEDAAAARCTTTTAEAGRILARGAMPGVGYLLLDDAVPERDGLKRALTLAAGETRTVCWFVGWAADVSEIAPVDAAQSYADTRAYWDDLLSRVVLETPDPALNRMVTRFLPYQVLAGRVFARAGLYQAGGAYGFRDQLQDMLALIAIDPARVRTHLLRCAARQFEAGDVLHWWHEPRTGVRTRISDDLLFLPYVTARYVLETGDRAVLDERAPYLRDEPIPDNRDDLYFEASEGEVFETLNQHCMRAIDRASNVGAHGLPRMGGGDWNDGMNRVRGESVWLGEFLAATADLYARVAPEEEREKLRALRDGMRAAVEASWDGAWYRRAYYESGEVMGGETSENGCQIDLVAQAWAALNGQPRAKQAMDSAWARLVDEDLRIIRLLTPPFAGDPPDPGYIAAYPPGVRENGGQYTHAACWAVMAWAALDDAERAWRALRMLMPDRHARTEADALTYRVEPYVVAGDVYGEAPYAGRGGWTWYTGSAAWMIRAVLDSLMGLTRRGDRVTLDALLPQTWREASVRLRFGGSTYRLTASRDAQRAILDGAPLAGAYVTMADDGKPHEAVFPVRRGGGR